MRVLLDEEADEAVGKSSSTRWTFDTSTSERSSRSRPQGTRHHWRNYLRCSLAV